MYCQICNKNILCWQLASRIRGRTQNMNIKVFWRAIAKLNKCESHLKTNSDNCRRIVLELMQLQSQARPAQPDERALPGVPLDHCRRHRLLHHDADGDNLAIYGRGAHAQHYHLFDWRFLSSVAIPSFFFATTPLSPLLANANWDNLEIYGRGAHYAKQSEKALFLLLQWLTKNKNQKKVLPQFFVERFFYNKTTPFTPSCKGSV